MGLVAREAVMKDLEMMAGLVPSRPLLVVEGGEFDHIWMLSHRPGRLWSCWCFWVCWGVDGAILYGFDRSLDQANGRNR